MNLESSMEFDNIEDFELSQKFSYERDIFIKIRDLHFEHERRNQNICGLGRDRTGDLTIFSRSLVPTELPSQTRF